MELTEKQKQQLKKKGITLEQLQEQLNRFDYGFPGVRLLRAACIDDGITRVDLTKYAKLYDDQSGSKSQIKFVPASGAASRMFRFLHHFLSDFDPKKDDLNTYREKEGREKIDRFISNLESFPFYQQVTEKMDTKAEKGSGEWVFDFVHTMLSTDGLAFSDLPKGLVPFHRYDGNTATAFEEHLYEAARQFPEGRAAHVHFTVADTAEELFKEELSKILPRLEKETGRAFKISFSYQHPRTDTVAVEKKSGQPVAMQNGELFFRPAGHGALLDNLNDIDQDLIFIKNIDNVATRPAQKDNIVYKKMLGGLALEFQHRIHTALEDLEKDGSEESIQNAMELIDSQLCRKLPEDLKSQPMDEQIKILKTALDRPLRVCGMVKNEGEPGGGPFWVRNSRGEVSVEIVEGAQVDTSDEEQNKIASSGTHFNPVDIVCAVKDHKGKKYDLLDFRDPDTGIITEKFIEDKPIRAQEMPGLWNGGMAYWNTIFVEVPISTFNPVKTVNDLLRKAHNTA